MKHYILFEKLRNQEFDRIKNCKHPKESRVDYHDGAVLCDNCGCIISQFGKTFDEPTPLVGNMPDEFFLKEVDESTVLDKVRQAFADYKATEGCSCCEDTDGHKEAENHLAELLKPDRYDDDSGFDWYKYKTPKP